MTATPRIYGDMAKATAEKDNTVLYDMNNEAQFGKQLHVITFSEAVQLKLLTDYKVIVLTIDEAHVSARIQDLLKDDSNQLKVDDAARIIGCWKALAKQGLTEDLSSDPDPMRRAVAFCQVIERSSGRHPQGQLQADRRDVRQGRRRLSGTGKIRQHPPLPGRPRGRRHERRPEGGKAQLAQGRGPGQHLPHPQQRPLPV